MKQWDVVRVRLGKGEGSEQSGRRPALVVSNDLLNQQLDVVVVLPITSRKPGRRVYPTEVLVPAGTAGLPYESIVMAHQIRTLSHSRVGETYGVLDSLQAQTRVRRAVETMLGWYGLME